MPLQLEILGFVIYYANGIVVKGTTISHWVKSHNEGVQAVALFYKNGKAEIIRGKELYMLYHGRHGLTFYGTTEKPHPMQELCSEDEIKIGKLMEAHAHQSIIQKAEADTYGH